MYESHGIDVMQVKTPLISFEKPDLDLKESSDVHQVEISQSLI